MLFRSWNPLNNSDDLKETARFWRAVSYSSFGRFALGDQPGAMLAGNIGPQPAPRDSGTASCSNQEEDVRNTPEPPRDNAFQLEAPHIDHSSASADGGKIALMLVTERHWRRLSFDAAFMTVAT